MLDFLSPAGIDGLARAAWHTTLLSLLTTVVLFAYTLGLRAATVLHERRERDAERRWHDVLARAATGEEALAPPRIRRYETTIVLELWNTFRALVDGVGADSLIRLGRFAGIERIAKERVDSPRLTARLLGAQTLGFLRSDVRWGELVDLLDDDNTALSITAALALARIDPERALPPLLSRLPRRRDWPKINVSQMLTLLGSDRIGEPFADLLRHAESDTQAYLVKFLPLLPADVCDMLATDLLRASTDPRVLASCLKLVSGRLGLPRLRWLAAHDVAFVRIQAARALGRLGEPEHVDLLTRMICDREWWVRYRAAQALVSLPFLGPNALRRMRDAEEDRYAADALEQAMAEAGLA